MAENDTGQERTEQPTPKRREDARRKGDVPRSRELTMTGVMLSGAAAMLLMSGPAAEKIKAGFEDALEFDASDIADPRFMLESLSTSAEHALVAIAPLALVLLLAVFLSATSIGGWAFSLKAAAPKL